MAYSDGRTNADDWSSGVAMDCCGTIKAIVMQPCRFVVCGEEAQAIPYYIGKNIQRNRRGADHRHTFAIARCGRRQEKPTIRTSLFIHELNLYKKI